MSIMQYIDVVIIGAGPIGLFTVFQAGMLGMKCYVIDVLDCLGGQCVALYPEKPIYDIPAYPIITGTELVEKLKKQAEPFNPTYYLGQQVVECKVNDDSRIKVVTSSGHVIITKVLIIAAGSGAFVPKKPPIKNIEDFENKTVFYSVKSREIFKGKKIVIAGGGDSAVDWALSLSELAEVIYLVHRRQTFRCLPQSLIRINQLVEKGKIHKIIPYQLNGLVGENGIIKEVVLSDLNGNKKSLPADYLLAFFGLSADLGPIYQWGIKTSLHHIDVNLGNYETNVPGIYAIGDVASYPGKLKLILTGFAEAASALHHCYSRVFDGKVLHFQHSTTKGVPI